MRANMPETPNVPLIGYHGCDLDNVQSIKDNNFRTSQGDIHYRYLGEGAYFFGAGISDPAENAKKWALREAKIKGFQKFAVLKVHLRPKKLLDISCSEGKAYVNHVRSELLLKLKKTPRDGYDDSKLLKLLVKEMKFDVLIYDFWIKFDGGNIRSNFPNVRMICTFWPATVVDKENIINVNSGLIS